MHRKGEERGMGGECGHVNAQRVNTKSFWYGRFYGLCGYGARSPPFGAEHPIQELRVGRHGVDRVARFELRIFGCTRFGSLMVQPEGREEVLAGVPRLATRLHIPHVEPRHLRHECRSPKHWDCRTALTKTRSPPNRPGTKGHLLHGSCGGAANEGDGPNRGSSIWSVRGGSC